MKIGFLPMYVCLNFIINLDFFYIVSAQAPNLLNIILWCIKRTFLCVNTWPIFKFEIWSVADFGHQNRKSKLALNDHMSFPERKNVASCIFDYINIDPGLKQSFRGRPSGVDRNPCIEYAPGFFPLTPSASFKFVIRTIICLFRMK